MDADKRRLAAVLGAAALALPGGALVGNAIAAGGDTGSGASTTQQAPPDPGFAPTQDEAQPDQPRDEADPDCPKDGRGPGPGPGSGGGGSSDDSGSGSGTSTEGTAL